MNRRNYTKEMDKVIANAAGNTPRLLLHSCCGPCSSSVLETLTRSFNVTLLWYNPNLYPEAEYDLRLRTQRELLEKAGYGNRVQILAVPWGHMEYLSAVTGLEGEPEGGKRCTECFRLRLRKCAELAKQYGFDYYCTTLTVSRHKDTVRINALGEEIGKEVGIAWLPNEFKKRGGEMRSQELAKQYGLYQQLYCGCEFSLRKDPLPENESNSGGNAPKGQESLLIL